MGKKGKARKAQRRKQKKEMTNMTKAPSNYKTTTTTTWKAPKPPCHSGQNKVFTTTGGIDVYAGGRNRSGGWWVMRPAPDLAIGPDETMHPFNSKTTASTVVPEGWSCDQFIGRTDPPKFIIEMDFPDFGVPQVEDYFWYALHDDIVEHGIKTISTQCAGGHGRTGVQLAILYYLLNDDDVKASITDAAQLIELVRELHCDHAVETNEQQRYIARVLDIPAGVSVIHNKYGGWSDYTWPTGGDKGKAKQATTTGKTSPKTTTDITGYDLDEKYNMTPKASVFERCECCDELEFDMDEEKCGACLWQPPQHDGETHVCYTCGNHKFGHEYLTPNDESCMTCVAREINVKHSDLEVECYSCKKMKYTDMVAEANAEGFLCLACEVKQ